MTDFLLEASLLTAEAFADFGDVVECGARWESLNQGTAKAFRDIAALKLDAQGGRPRLRIFRVSPQALPLPVALLERHRLCSQLFMPLARRAFLVVVAPAGQVPGCSSVRAFLTDGSQGVNYHPGVWHHPVIALERETDFLVLDREGPGEDCDEAELAPRVRISVPQR